MKVQEQEPQFTTATKVGIGGATITIFSSSSLFLLPYSFLFPNHGVWVQDPDPGLRTRIQVGFEPRTEYGLHLNPELNLGLRTRIQVGFDLHWFQDSWGFSSSKLRCTQVRLGVFGQKLQTSPAATMITVMLRPDFASEITSDDWEEDEEKKEKRKKEKEIKNIIIFLARKN